MERVYTVNEIKNAEKVAIESGLNEDILIENAAAALYRVVVQSLPPNGRIIVFVGTGKNGADGLSAARMLFLDGYNVQVFTVGSTDNAYCAQRINAFKQLGGYIQSFDSQDYNADVIIDALLGVGLAREMSGDFLRAVQCINKSKALKIAVDVPSGLGANDGKIWGDAVKADKTVTFGGAKIGLVLGEGRACAGEIEVFGIGIVPKGGYKVTGEKDAMLPPRSKTSHKYHMGKVCVIGGSYEMPGAALLALKSAVAALTSGAGLCTLCVAKSMMPFYAQRVLENTLCYLSDNQGKVQFKAEEINKALHKVNAVALGMGMGANDQLIKIIEHILLNFDGTVVLDADALNAISSKNCLPLFANKQAKVILTPHWGEMKRLTEMYLEGESWLEPDVPQCIQMVARLAQKLKVTVVAKGAITLISDGVEVIMNITGTPAMAKGGSGDVLAGMIAAYACRTEPLHASIAACYWMGKNGENAQKEKGMDGVLASNLFMNNA